MAFWALNHDGNTIRIDWGANKAGGICVYYTVTLSKVEADRAGLGMTYDDFRDRTSPIAQAAWQRTEYILRNAHHGWCSSSPYTELLVRLRCWTTILTCHYHLRTLQGVRTPRLRVPDKSRALDAYDRRRWGRVRSEAANKLSGRHGPTLPGRERRQEERYAVAMDETMSVSSQY